MPEEETSETTGYIIALIIAAIIIAIGVFIFKSQIFDKLFG